MASHPDDRSPRRSVLVVAALGTAIVVLALSLRSGVGSLGVVLPEVRDDLGLSAAVTGLLTTLPVLCFAVVGLGAGRAILRFGVHRVAVVLLVAVAAGFLGRSVAGSASVFLVCTAVAMAGAALGNVALPPLAKRHFPDHVPLISAVYGAAVVGGATIASTATVPISDAFGGWRWGLGAWAVVAVAGALLWVPTVVGDAGRRSDPTAEAEDAPGFGAVARTRTGRVMALCFAAQSAQAYVQFGWWGEMLTSAGADDAHAGLLLGALTGVSLPVTLCLPRLIRVTGGSAVLPVAFGALTTVGWIGLIVAPLALGGWLWAVLMGIGGVAFTWILAMIGARARTAAGTSQLSAVTQGLGYVGSSAVPFGVGLLHDATGSWTGPMVVMIALAVVIAVSGALVARSAPVEDELTGP